MTVPINFQDPIETLFKHIEDGVRYNNAGMQPCTEAQHASMAFLLIPNTGEVPDACRYWQRHTPMHHTWADFRREFSRAQREQRIISSTVMRAGYHTENVAEHYVQIQLPAYGGFVTSMANLATTTSAYRAPVATLTKAIATLTDQLAEKYIWAKSKEAEIKHLLGGRAPHVAVVTAGPAGAYVRKYYKNKNDN
jgi:hypothetical protein